MPKAFISSTSEDLKTRLRECEKEIAAEERAVSVSIAERQAAISALQHELQMHIESDVKRR